MRTDEHGVVEAEREATDGERLVVLVGFDGSPPAQRALDVARQLVAGRIGSIEVVYVAHVAVGAEMSPVALVETLKGFDAIEQEVAEVVRGHMEGVERPWRFQRRNGLVAHELIAEAERLQQDYGEDASVLIVVGGAAHAYHHVIGSVPVALVRHAKFPVVVVP